MRRLFSVILFGIYNCGIITSTGYIAIVEKWVSFNFLRMKVKIESNQQRWEIIWGIF